MISKSVSQEKWQTGLGIVTGLSDLLREHSFGRPLINRKELEGQIGFLYHLSTTFDDMTLF